MTTTTKDITNFLEEKGIDFKPVRMDWLLGKLTYEELDDFLYLLESLDNSAKSFERGYQEGYDEGRSYGYNEGYDVGIEDQGE